MKKISLLVAGLMLIGTAGVASARSQAASLGHAVWSWSDEVNCFRTQMNLNGGIKNTCAGTTLWDVQMVQDSAGAKTVVASGYASNTTTCIARGLDRYGNVYAQSGWVAFPTSSPSYSAITLTGASVPNAGYMQLQCNISQNQILYSVVW
jgi:hypothetical protein